jgi:hypothetical protein
MSEHEGDATLSPHEPSLGRATIAVDEGLHRYMLGIYNYMLLGLAVTGLAALSLYLLSVTGEPAAAMKVFNNGASIPVPIGRTLFLTPIGYYTFVSPLKWLVMLSPLALVLGLSFGIERLRPLAAHLLFWLFAALMGISLSAIFMVFAQTSIARVFFIAAASFGVLSLWGYTTQRDLSGIGSFLLMGLFGLILASLVNLFTASAVLQFVISVAGILIFAGLTAWDTQRLKHEYLQGSMDGETADRSSVLGALSLYLNFVNLFALLLQLLGRRQR